MFHNEFPGRLEFNADYTIRNLIVYTYLKVLVLFMYFNRTVIT